MGNYASNRVGTGAEAQVDAEEEEDYDELGELLDEVSSADSAAARPAPAARPPPVEPAVPRTFASLAAGPKKKKTLEYDVNAAAAKFAALQAQKREAAKLAAAAAKNAGRLAGTKKQESIEGDLPRGGDGAIWQAKEDSQIREDRDVKSARRGVLQMGERCRQTGPWRADSSGRVRMPISGPRNMEGWVTLDSRKCQSADGTWGTLCLELIEEATEEDRSGDAGAREALAAPTEPQPRSHAANEIEELLDIFGGAELEQQASPGQPAADDDACAKLVRAWQQDATTPAAAAEGISSEQAEEQLVAAGSSGGSILSDAEKRLRNAKKKLRELEELEAQIAADGMVLSEAQRKKLSRKAELQQEEEAAAAAVAAEKKAAAGPRRRAGNKKTGKKASEKATTLSLQPEQSSDGWGGVVCAYLVGSFVIFVALMYASGWGSRRR